MYLDSLAYDYLPVFHTFDNCIVVLPNHCLTLDNIVIILRETLNNWERLGTRLYLVAYVVQAGAVRSSNLLYINFGINGGVAPVVLPIIHSWTGGNY